MSTVLEPSITGGFAPKNLNGTGTAPRRTASPLGLNAQKVVAKRYALKDENGEAMEVWEDIVRRVVGHVATAETDPKKQSLFYDEMTSVMLARGTLASSWSGRSHENGSSASEGTGSALALAPAPLLGASLAGAAVEAGGDAAIVTLGLAV